MGRPNITVTKATFVATATEVSERREREARTLREAPTSVATSLNMISKTVKQ